MDDYTKASALGFGLVMFTQLVSVVARPIRSGRSAFGHLEKTIEVPVEKINEDFSLKLFRQRLADLGFKPLDNDNNFVQGGVDLAALGSALQAKTKKLLSLQARDSGPNQVVVSMTVRYPHFVIVDTGESAYRDALLDFVSGKADQMTVVPQESLMATNSFTGGIIACLVGALLIATNRLNLWPVIPILGVTEFAAGLLAIVSISQKPAEITGRWKAVAGIVLSLAAIAITLTFIITTRSAGSY